jgi:hypothetical protein
LIGARRPSCCCGSPIRWFARIPRRKAGEGARRFKQIHAQAETNTGASRAVQVRRASWRGHPQSNHLLYRGPSRKLTRAWVKIVVRKRCRVLSTPHVYLFYDFRLIETSKRCCFGTYILTSSKIPRPDVSKQIKQNSFGHCSGSQL